jgi:hypothetical protein
MAANEILAVGVLFAQLVGQRAGGHVAKTSFHPEVWPDLPGTDEPLTMLTGSVQRRARHIEFRRGGLYNPAWRGIEPPMDADERR